LPKAGAEVPMRKLSNGLQTGDLVLTSSDKTGARALYP
jgi:hypothetical protein